MVLQVEIPVESPGEVGDAAEQLGGMLAERRRDVIAVDDVLVKIAKELRSGAFGWFEQLQTGDMHGVFA